MVGGVGCVGGGTCHSLLTVYVMIDILQSSTQFTRVIKFSS